LYISAKNEKVGSLPKFISPPGVPLAFLCPVYHVKKSESTIIVYHNFVFGLTLSPLGNNALKLAPKIAIL
jgi:hypothetical protein